MRNLKFPCPVCQHPTIGEIRVVISPWIRELGIRTRFSRYLLCTECNTGSFTKRFSSVEMGLIYKDYRGEKYLRIRSKWEPWYSEKYNSNHDSLAWIESRKQSITTFLIANNITSCNSIIDVGGDRGQYIPDLASTKIVYDISEKATLPGVIRISSFDLLPHSDLIIYAHVLEHVDNPVLELRNLFEKSNRIYVEVPFGIPEVNSHRKSLIRFLFHWFSSFNRFTWRRVTSPATGRKVNKNKMMTQSEHLTFFNEESMKKIASILNASIIVKRSSISTPDLSTGEVLQCILTLK